MPGRKNASDDRKSISAALSVFSRVIHLSGVSAGLIFVTIHKNVMQESVDQGPGKTVKYYNSDAQLTVITNIISDIYL